MKNEVYSKTPPKRHALGTPCVIVVSVLVVVNMIYFGLLALQIDRIIWQQMLFRLDFRYWPFEAVYVLWFIFVWLLIDAVTFRQRKRPVIDEEGKANTVRIIVFVLKLAVACFFVAPLLNPMRIRLIRRLLTDHYFVPMTQFFHDGSLSWKLMISPLLAVIVIGFLLHLKRKFQNSKHHTP